MRRTAWGKMMHRLVCSPLRPVERVASSWPLKADWIPPGTTLVVLAIIQDDVVMTAAENAGILRPLAGGPKNEDEEVLKQEGNSAEQLHGPGSAGTEDRPGDEA